MSTVKKEIRLDGHTLPLIVTEALIVGSGAAGYATADALYEKGVRDILIVTEGIRMGTSRNTGSDKQTYYKLSLSGGAPDSVYDMARTLMSGGSMHGDIALADAANSARSFFKLVSLGVPFPTNAFGEFVGYRTDHDATTRATSAGPLTSKYMTEALEKAVLGKKIPVLDGHRVIRLLTENGRACGVLTLCKEQITEENPTGLSVFAADNTIFAVGGPSAIYADTVYPESQTSSLGVAFSAGAMGANLTESQYGIASTGFRWNLSGTYQQVLPRYVSVDANGVEREFLYDVFASDTEMQTAVFHKGYEWPFDPKKTVAGGSSRIDLAVFREHENGRRVYLDYRRNPSSLMTDGVFDEAKLPPCAADYLARSDAMADTPVLRLEKMNPAAKALYASHGIDLAGEMLEIAVCAQHNNGGIAVLPSRECVNLKHFYAVGECAGTFGVTRPGGSALCSTQTGALLAAEDIALRAREAPSLSEGVLQDIRAEMKLLLSLDGELTRDGILAKRREYGKRMSAVAAFLRDPAGIEAAIAEVDRELSDFESTYRVASGAALADAMISRDILVTQRVYLGAMSDYIRDGGMSRGSYLVTDQGVNGALRASVQTDERHFGFVQNTVYMDGRTHSTFEPVRPLPESDQWFERVWRDFRNRKGLT